MNSYLAMLCSTGPDVLAAVDMAAAALKAVRCNTLGNIQSFRSPVLVIKCR